MPLGETFSRVHIAYSVYMLYTGGATGLNSDITALARGGRATPPRRGCDYPPSGGGRSPPLSPSALCGQYLSLISVPNIHTSVHTSQSTIVRGAVVSKVPPSAIARGVPVAEHGENARRIVDLILNVTGSDAENEHRGKPHCNCCTHAETGLRGERHDDRLVRASIQKILPKRRKEVSSLKRKSEELY